jgi:hypothetical protein
MIKRKTAKTKPKIMTWTWEKITREEIEEMEH